MQFPCYPHPLQMHSTPTQVSKFWFVPLFLLPLATLRCWVFFFFLAFTLRNINTGACHYCTSFSFWHKKRKSYSRTLLVHITFCSLNQLWAMSCTLSVSVPFSLPSLNQFRNDNDLKKSLPSVITPHSDFIKYHIRVLL